MKQIFWFAILAATTLALPNPTLADLKVKTKSNIKNDRVAGSPSLADSNGLVFSWGDNDAAARAVTSADFIPDSGSAFSECSSTCNSSAKVSLQDLSLKSSGPGILNLRFGATGAGLPSRSTVCPIANTDAGPIKGIVVKGGRNPGGIYFLRGAMIRKCDADSMAISYQGLTIKAAD